MNTGGFALGAVLLATATLGACADEDTSVVVPGTGDRIFIEDRTGKRWDVTYAVAELGFRVEDFNFGLGPDAIPPIVDPEFLLPDDPNYPSPDAAFRVLGMTAGADARAYAVTEIAGHEVVNDRVGELHFAATY